MTGRAHTRSAERGFTLIEVIVAFVVIAIVAIGATALISTSSKLTTRTKVSDRQRMIADALLEKMTSNVAWVKKHSCGPGTDVCAAAAADIVAANARLLEEPDGTLTHTPRITISGVDLPNDGPADGRVDLFRISVRVTTTGPASMGVLPPHEATTTLDMAIRETTGTLELRACEAQTQIDERLATGVCLRNGTETYDLKPPVLPCALAWECSSWNAARAANLAYTRATVVPLTGQSFTLTGPLPGGSSRTIAPGTHSALPVGQYRLTPALSNVREVWRTHSVPAGGFVTVSAGETEYATQLFKPLLARLVLDVDTLNITDPENFVVEENARLRQSFRLIPNPANRSPFPTGQNMGWTRIDVGTDRVNVIGGAPGLFASRILLYPGDLTAPLNNLPFLFVNANGTTVPAPLEYRQTYCDLPQRQAILRARCDAWYPGINTQHCVNPNNGVEYEPCQGGEGGGSVDVTGSPGA